MDSLPADPDQAAQFVWWMSLALGVVVSAVVALLLWAIHAGARAIEAHVARIWDVGQRVAGNTVHIPALYRTNELAGRILATAGNIDSGAAAIESHAKGCPGCPQCMLGGGKPWR